MIRKNGIAKAFNKRNRFSNTNQVVYFASMCYDVSFTVDLKQIVDYFPDLVFDLKVRFDFPSSTHVLAQAFRACPVAIYDDEQYKLKEVEWGVIAGYMNTPEKIKKARSFMCNAQGEKILRDKKSYWSRIEKNRCLIPITGTYEHREITGWKNKVPYFIKLMDREVCCLPGLFGYSPVPDPDTGEVKGTFTIITRAENGSMKQIHNGGPNTGRIPLFMKDKEMELDWLDPSLSDDDMAAILDFELPSEDLEYHPVYTIRSPKPRPDSQPKNVSWVWEGLPELMV